MSVKKYTELDFDQIKENLKSFLRTQPEFKDVDYEGSSINVLLDMLAYSTAYNGFYANMVANEGYLETAIKRENVVSRAKAIGYTPRSRVSSVATIQIDFRLDQVSNIPVPSVLEIPKNLKFKSTFENKEIEFRTNQNYILRNSGNTVNGIYKGIIKLYEGYYLKHKFVVDNVVFPEQRYVIPNIGVDAERILVSVQENSSSSTLESYRKVKDVTTVKTEEPIYFVQEDYDGYLELFFGDGILGKKLEDGNVIHVDYYVVSGKSYDGLNKFVLNELVYTNYPPVPTINPYKITTLESARHGQEEESIESIRFLAPKFYEAQNRSVNKFDYETLLLKDYPEIEYVRVWGGEENDPPKYGVVYVSLKPKNALVFNPQEKIYILNQVIKPKNPVSIQVEIVDPEYTRIVVSSTVNYDSNISGLEPSQIETLVRNSIHSYADSNLIGFKGQFRLSKLISTIDSAEDSIKSNSTDIKLKFGVTPPLFVKQQYIFSFQSALDRGDSKNNVTSIDTSAFTYKGFECRITDDGSGTLYIYRKQSGVKVILESNIGTVDYNTGNITIPSLVIENIVDGSSQLYFTAVPAQSDFFAKQNRIIVIEDSDIQIEVIDEAREF